MTEFDTFSLDDVEVEIDRELIAVDRKAIAFRSLSNLYAQDGRTDRFLESIVTTDFLAEQSDYFGFFGRTLEDLLRFVLPETIRTANWQQFLRFAAIAINIEGFTADLADAEIVAALARGGRLDLAFDAAEQIHDPWARVQALSSLAKACPADQGSHFRRILGQIIKTLDDAAAHPADTDRSESIRTLSAVARSLGPIPGLHWPAWISAFAPTVFDSQAIYRALAEAWLDLGQPERPELWDILATMGHSELVEFAPKRLGALSEPQTAVDLLGRFQALFDSNAESRCRATVRFLSEFSERHSSSAVDLWLAEKGEPITWSASLVDGGRSLLLHLPENLLTSYSTDAHTAEARAALRTIALEAYPSTQATAAAIAAVHQISDPAARLHRALHFLEVRPRSPDGAARNQLLAVAAHLDEIEFDAAAADLTRFLDLSAELLEPRDLGTFLDGVVWAPSADGKRLLEIARTARNDRVLSRLTRHAERYAAAVSKTQPEGFTLRGRLRSAASLRRCLLKRTLAPLADAIELLLPEEEDDLRFELALAFAREGLRDLALKAGKEIVDPRRRLLARLEGEAATTNRPKILSRDIYAALSRVEPLTDEARGLGLLFEPPIDPVEVADRRLKKLSGRSSEIRALLRLAEHSLAFQQRFPTSRRDLLAPLELLRVRIGFENDDELAAATPDVALIAARLNPKRADLELGEAARRLLGLETVRWDDRLAAFSRLVGITRRLASEPDFTKPAGKALAAMARLPKKIEPRALRNELGKRWSEVAPAFTAEILPEVVSASEIEWLEALAKRIGQGEIDPNSTALSPILHRLWTCDESESQPRLANAVLDALRSGGRPHGEAALRLFLHAHLAPRLGSDRPDKEEDLAEALAAFEAALSLTSTGLPIPVPREVSW